MRRIVKPFLIALALIIVVVGAAAAYIAMHVMDATPLVDGTELPGGAVTIVDGYVAVFAIPIGGDRVVLVDCGVDTEAKAIRRVLDQKKWVVDSVLLTHGHGDHINGCPSLGAPIIALGAEAPYLAGTVRLKGALTKLFPPHGMGIKIANVASDGDEIKLGTKTAKVFAVPGHTPGSAAYLIDGVLYLGDVAGFNKAGEVAASPWFLSDDDAQNKASVRALAARLDGTPVEWLAPSHSAAKKVGASALATVK